MKYLLKKHPQDEAMIEATCTWVDSKKEEYTILAFVVHVDCIEDDNIKHELSVEGMAHVEVLVCPNPSK